MRTPVAVFTYNRPDHTNRLLESLSRCTHLDECDIHIYCDGPKKPEQMPAIEASRQVVRRWAEQRGAAVIEREENQGLARSIVTGVTELCAACGRAIILEDDLVLSPVFLDYMLQALDRYAGEPNVYQVSGYMFPISHAPKPETSFLPLTTTWGWATWQRAWQAFSWDVPSAREHLADPDFRRRFDLDDSYPYSTMLEQRLADQNDSWGILWWYTVFNRRGLVLYPRLSLVQNLGFDGSGVHCGTSNQDVSQAVVPDRLLPPFTFPDAVEMDEEVFERVKAYMRALQPAQPPPKASFVTRIGHRMKRLIS